MYLGDSDIILEKISRMKYGAKDQSGWRPGALEFWRPAGEAASPLTYLPCPMAAGIVCSFVWMLLLRPQQPSKAPLG